MDIDKLLETIAVISQILNTPSLTTQIDKDPDLGIKVKKFETLVEKIRAQQGDFSVSNENLKKIFNELYSVIVEIDNYCDLNLRKLNFLNNLKPLS
tara:strand:- start:13 stop:300 length:288 start_codon:yes stop_codon:yes gene_type:complete